MHMSESSCTSLTVVTRPGYALLIDDDAPMLRSVNRAVASRGLELLTASSWNDGLALFHVYSPELVIADYNLPGTEHGLKLLARLRSTRPSGRFILVSGYIDAVDAAAIEALGLVDRALPKTGAVETLSALLDEVEAAKMAAESPTDWQEYAEAYSRSGSVSTAELEELDRIIRSRRGID